MAGRAGIELASRRELQSKKRMERLARPELSSASCEHVVLAAIMLWPAKPVSFGAWTAVATLGVACTAVA